MHLVFSTSTVIKAQGSSEHSWAGQWVAEGTLFKVSVDTENSVMTVSQIESMGFVWSSKAGKVTGNIATVEVEYAGAAGIVKAELIDRETVVVSAATCLPEYMVVCLLTKDQQAIFKKVTAPN